MGTFVFLFISFFIFEAVFVTLRTSIAGNDPKITSRVSGRIDGLCILGYDQPGRIMYLVLRIHILY